MYAKKQLTISIALAEGQFSNGTNEVTLPQVPTVFSCDKTGGAELPKCTIEVENLSLELMQRLTVLAFKNLQTFKNVVKVTAGEEGQQGMVVFEGEIAAATPEFSNDGNVKFKIEAITGYYPLQVSESPVSVAGDTTIESLMSTFAASAGYELENNGVTGSVRNSEFRGSPVMKARALAKQTGIDLLIEDGKFIITPSYLDVREGSVPLLNKNSGMIGYPSFTSDGVQVRCLYTPQVKLGGMIKIESIVPQASGVWRVNKIHYDLSAYQSAAGPWDMTIDGAWLAEN